ncbi:helix-turn-helix transcriptional regulator [Limosilactobacillus oris]|uniref:helix-turn-helix transcriptional regulator n=1 Tax=Limosilactobacillus oris TaxID=1632 RepID=UPI0022E6773E|nr:helix-turn-helix domain-containing protein [Limosilactobacillus oris]
MTETVKKNSADILESIIEKRGLKKNYLAKEMGISPSSMSALLHGNKRFTADIALKAGKALGVSSNIFLDKSYSK